MHYGGASVSVDAPDIASIPRLAAGGIVTDPTLAALGESGPEAVIPLSRLNRAGGGVSVNYYGPVTIEATTAQAVLAVEQVRGVVEAMSAAAHEVAVAVAAQKSHIAGIASGADVAAEWAGRSATDIAKVNDAASGAGEIVGRAQQLASALRREATELDGAVNRFLADVRAA